MVNHLGLLSPTHEKKLFDILYFLAGFFFFPEDFILFYFIYFFNL